MLTSPRPNGSNRQALKMAGRPTRSAIATRRPSRSDRSRSRGRSPTRPRRTGVGGPPQPAPRPSGADVGEALAAALGGAAIAEFLRVFLRMQSVVGVVIWWSVGFLVLYYLLLRDSHDRRAAVDRVVTIVVWAAGALVTGALAWMVCFAFRPRAAEACVELLYARSQQGRSAESGWRSQARHHRNARTGRHRHGGRRADRDPDRRVPERAPRSTRRNR